MAAQSYISDNVYLYDKDFRIHMAKHPTRSWSIILQQAWAVRLREKIKSHSGGSTSDRDVRKADLCKQFNKTGRCSFRSSCRYEHRCSFCFKFGHAVINCRRLKAEYGYSSHRDRRRSRLRSRGRDDYRSKKQHQGSKTAKTRNGKKLIHQLMFVNSRDC